MDRIPTELAFLCSTLSPFTTEVEIEELRRLAAAGMVDWERLASYANHACLIPALHQALVHKDLLANLPEQFKGYLEEVYRLNLERNKTLWQQLLEVVKLLNGVSISPTLLKGAAALATELFPNPGSRFMCDLDLLVPEDQMAAAVNTLQNAGYKVPEQYKNLPYASVENKIHHHFAPLVHPNQLGAIELHRKVLRGGALLDREEVWARNQPCVSELLQEASAAVLSPTDELICCFGHSELSDHNHRDNKVDLRQLHHFTQLCYRNQEQIEWERLEALKQDPKVGPTLTSYLLLAKKFFRVNTPLTDDRDPYALRHFQKIISQVSPSKKAGFLLRNIVGDAVRAFSKKNMLFTYPAQDVSITRLRLRHLLFLMRRYSDADVWKAKFIKRRPF